MSVNHVEQYGDYRPIQSDNAPLIDKLPTASPVATANADANINLNAHSKFPFPPAAPNRKPFLTESHHDISAVEPARNIAWGVFRCKGFLL